mmetsp:Transcript_3277/g.9745  ORF Transcript_3277/g.9745 Transcript_3277/m.9745 type:complete len:331 (+) Transcript_3277:3-995(+)
MLYFLFSPLAYSPPEPADVDAQWRSWQLQHRKNYASEADIAARRLTWLESRELVEEQNARPDSWTAELNEFADLTWPEFQAKRLMAPQNCSATHVASWSSDASAKLPEALDWRQKILAPWPVKNQAHCGSCWTFSTVGSMEAHVYLKYGAMKNLSEQQLVDCAGAFHNHGCNGGLPSQAFEYIHFAGGLDTEAVYPYVGKTGKTCAYDKQGVAKVSAINNITAYDEAALLAAVGSRGPVSIAFQVSADFRFYKKGVYDGVCKASPSDVNHAVVAVGYGVSPADGGREGGKPFFIVRNSWGPTWGEEGYFRIARGKNKCGLADCASFPSIA